jgi:predicted nicotinamide N-methyase
MSNDCIEEEEFVDNLIPLFSTNVLPQGKLVIPGGTEVFCFTRAYRTNPSAQDSLFVDDLWPGCRVLADYLIKNIDIFVGKSCLELGAGGALPSVVAASLGAKHVTITDYPAPDVIENIRDVISANKLNNACAIGHIWGAESAQEILDLSETNTLGEKQGFDVIFMAELLWKDTYSLHRKLLESLSICLNKANGIAYMAFANRPTSQSLGHTAEKDNEFFELARGEFGMESHLLATNSEYCDVGESVTIDVHLLSLQFMKP